MATKYKNNSVIYSVEDDLFKVSAGGSNSLVVESDGSVVVEKLVIRDSVTGNKWNLKICDGEFIIEPTTIEDKRQYKINKILDNARTS